MPETDSLLLHGKAPRNRFYFSFEPLGKPKIFLSVCRLLRPLTLTEYRYIDLKTRYFWKYFCLQEMNSVSTVVPCIISADL